jgi:hydrogenase maturation protein HypF
VETAPLVRAVVADVLAGRPVPKIAGAFHNALRDLIAETVTRVAARTGVRRVVLSGGVFQNVLLTERAADALERRGFQVLLHRRVPCNDGGLALGQAYVAACACRTNRRV